MSFTFIQLIFLGLMLLGTRTTRRLPRKRPPRWPEVSVVICAKNALSELKENLNSVLEQDYPRFEVLVILHNSEDGSFEWIKEQQEKQDHLSIAVVDDGKIGKKWALQSGLPSAKYDLIVGTDADCQPSSESWLRIMVQHMHETKALAVLGYGRHVDGKSWLAHLVSHETIVTAAQYVSWSSLGMTYMGVGRNIAYYRRHFLSQDWNIQRKSVSGDDDLFVQYLNRKGHAISCTIHAHAQTVTKSSKSIIDFFRQKGRHLSAGSKYPLYILLMLSVFSVTQIGMYLFGGLAILASFQSIWLIFLALVLRLFLMQRLYLLFSHRSDLLKIFWSDLLLSLYYAFVPIIHLSHPKQKW